MTKRKDTKADPPNRMTGCNPTPRALMAKALWMGKYTSRLPAEPQEFHAWAEFPEPNIFTNDYEGSCVECEAENAMMGLNHAAGRKVRFSKETVHQNYRTQTGGRDSGLDLGTSMEWHQKHATVDTDGNAHIDGPHGALNTDDLDELSKACYYFGGLNIAISSSQVKSTRPNQVVTGLRRSTRIDHCVALVGRKMIDGKRFWIMETWGYYLYLDGTSLSNILGEAWCRYAEDDRLKPDGKTLEGFDLKSLERDWAIYNGEPGPTPEPTPDPGPAPGPPPPGPEPEPEPTPAPDCCTNAKQIAVLLMKLISALSNMKKK